MEVSSVEVKCANKHRIHVEAAPVTVRGESAVADGYHFPGQRLPSGNLHIHVVPLDEHKRILCGQSVVDDIAVAVRAAPVGCICDSAVVRIPRPCRRVHGRRVGRGGGLGPECVRAAHRVIVGLDAVCGLYAVEHAYLIVLAVPADAVVAHRTDEEPVVACGTGSDATRICSDTIYVDCRGGAVVRHIDINPTIADVGNRRIRDSRARSTTDRTENRRGICVKFDFPTLHDRISCCLIMSLSQQASPIIDRSRCAEPAANGKLAVVRDFRGVVRHLEARGVVAVCGRLVDAAAADNAVRVCGHLRKVIAAVRDRRHGIESIARRVRFRHRSARRAHVPHTHETIPCILCDARLFGRARLAPVHRDCGGTLVDGLQLRNPDPYKRTTGRVPMIDFVRNQVAV